MHDEFVSSMDISRKMLKMTACAILPIDEHHKHLNELQTAAADNDSNDSAINDMNVCTDSLSHNPDTDCSVDIKDKTLRARPAITHLVSELDSDESNHICQHFTAKDDPKSPDCDPNLPDCDPVLPQCDPKSPAIEPISAEETPQKPEEPTESAKIVPESVHNEDSNTNSSVQQMDSSNLSANDSTPKDGSVEVLENGLKVIDGCVYPPYDPPADKPLRYTNQLQFLRTIMTKYLCRYKTAMPFLKPVNCVLLKIPDYYKVITNPMDMLTIKRRMLCLWYTNAEECLQDFRLMFNNCYKFNSCDSLVYNAGKKLEEYLDEKLKEMPKEEVEIGCPPKSTVQELEKKAAKRKSNVPTQELHDLNRSRPAGAPDVAVLLANAAKKPTTRSEHGIHMKKPTKELPEPTSVAPTQHLKRVPLNTSMKFCLDIIKELLSKKHRDYAWPFYEPVSTQTYPDYLEIVKKPIDLGTIKTKIETGQYKTVKPFVKDMRLMITNCLRYNKPEAPIIEQARKVRDFFEYRWARIPEELLKEKLTVNHNNHQNGGHSLEHKKESQEESSVENSRMKLLETQVRLLTSTLTALTGIETKTLKPKNGQKKSSVKKVANRANNRKKQSSNRADEDESDEDSEDEGSDDEMDDSDDEVPSPSPVVFDANNMEDLQQLKTDLENLDAKNLRNVLRILRQTEPSIKCDNDENIEIDFEALRPETLTNLRKFVSSCMLNNMNLKKSKV